jgi:hypothetical protein
MTASRANVFVMPVPSPCRVVTMAKEEARHSVANAGIHFARGQEWGSASAATSTAVVPTDPIHSVAQKGAN